jgi:hypothetical protein
VLGALRVLEEKGRAAGLHGPVDDLGHLEIGVDLGVDLDQLAGTAKLVDPGAQVSGRHAFESMALTEGLGTLLKRGEVAQELSDQDHAEEDGPDCEHDQDDVAAFLRRRLLRGEDECADEGGHGGPILLHPLGVEGEGPVARIAPRLRVAVEGGDGRGPGLSVAGQALRPEVGAEREELGERADCLYVPEARNAHETVGV